MRTIYNIFLGAILLLAGCTDSKLCELDHPHGVQVRVVNNWDDGEIRPTSGMRFNVFIEADSCHHAIDDLEVEGGVVTLPAIASYIGISYDYHGSDGVGFRNERTFADCEACCHTMTRGTYAKQFPSESTIAEPASLHVGHAIAFNVPANNNTTVDFHPVDVVKTYTFEIRRVFGAKFITDTRGAISGVSESYFITTESLAQNSSTLLFGAQKDSDTDRIIGSFRTFGFNSTNNIFTIEILYPSDKNGIKQISWDVSDQLKNNNTHIVIDANIHIVPEGEGSGFKADIESWEDEIIVPIPM